MPPEQSRRLAAGYPGIAVLAVAAALGLSLLHLWLRVLWPARNDHGFGAFRPWTGPAIAMFIIFVIIAIGWTIKVYTGPARTPARLRVTTGQTGLVGRLLRLFGFYLIVGVGGMLVVIVFDAGTHFPTASTIASTIIVFLYGLRRGPRPASLLGDGLSLLLLALLYLSFVAYQPFHHWLDSRPTPLAVTIDLLFLLGGAVLGWSLLRSRLMVWFRALRAWLEKKVPPAPEALPPPQLGRALAEWLAHALVVAVIFLLLRLLYTPLPTLLPYEDSVFFLGVDWYWVTALELFTSAELFILLALASFGFACSLEAWPLRTSNRAEA